MAELDPALAVELAKPRFVLFGAVEIIFPSGTVRLLDGSGEVPVGAVTFVGKDPDWGVLDTIKGVADTGGDTAPAITLGLIPSGDLALSSMLDPAVQGSAVTIYVGCLDQLTGLPIGELYVPFVGELDVPTVSWDANDRRVEFKATGIGERLFSIEEGRRLSDAFHQSVWPGELGLAFVTDVESWVPWGQQLKTNQPQIRTNLPGMNTFSGSTGGGGGHWGGLW